MLDGEAEVTVNSKSISRESYKQYLKDEYPDYDEEEDGVFADAAEDVELNKKGSTSS